MFIHLVLVCADIKEFIITQPEGKLEFLKYQNFE